jgi:hypothetical protein
LTSSSPETASTRSARATSASLSSFTSVPSPTKTRQLDLRPSSLTLSSSVRATSQLDSMTVTTWHRVRVSVPETRRPFPRRSQASSCETRSLVDDVPLHMPVEGAAEAVEPRS